MSKPLTKDDYKFISNFRQKYSINFKYAPLCLDMHASDPTVDWYEVCLVVAKSANERFGEIERLNSSLARVSIKDYMCYKLCAADIEILFRAMINGPEKLSMHAMALMKDDFFEADVHWRSDPRSYRRTDDDLRRAIYRFMKYGEYEGVKLYDDAGNLIDQPEIFVIDTSIFTLSPYLYRIALNAGAPPIEPDPYTLARCRSIDCLYDIYGEGYLSNEHCLLTALATDSQLTSMWFDPELTVYWLNHGILNPDIFAASLRLHSVCETQPNHRISTIIPKDAILIRNAVDQYWFKMRQDLIEYIIEHCKPIVLAHPHMQSLFGEFGNELTSKVVEKCMYTDINVNLNFAFHPFDMNEFSWGPNQRYLGVGRAESFVDDMLETSNTDQICFFINVCTVADADFYKHVHRIIMSRTPSSGDPRYERFYNPTVISFVINTSSDSTIECLVRDKSMVCQYYSSDTNVINYYYTNSNTFRRAKMLGISIEKSIVTLSSMYYEKNVIIAVADYINSHKHEAAQWPDLGRCFAARLRAILESPWNDFPPIEVYALIRALGTIYYNIYQHEILLDEIIELSKPEIVYDIMRALTDVGYSIKRRWIESRAIAILNSHPAYAHNYYKLLLDATFLDCVASDIDVTRIVLMTIKQEPDIKPDALIYSIANRGYKIQLNY